MHIKLSAFLTASAVMEPGESGDIECRMDAPPELTINPVIITKEQITKEAARKAYLVVLVHALAMAGKKARAELEEMGTDLEFVTEPAKASA